MESRVVVLLYVWLGCLWGVCDFLVEIVSGELFDFDIVEEGEEEWYVWIEDDGDLIILRLII